MNQRTNGTSRRERTSRNHGSRKGSRTQRRTRSPRLRSERVNLLGQMQAMQGLQQNPCLTVFGERTAVTFTGRNLDRQKLTMVLGLMVANSVIMTTGLEMGRVNLTKVDRTVDDFARPSQKTVIELGLTQPVEVITLRTMGRDRYRSKSLCGILTDVTMKVVAGHPEVTGEIERGRITETMGKSLLHGVFNRTAWNELGIEAMIVYSITSPTKRGDSHTQRFEMPWQKSDTLEQLRGPSASSEITRQRELTGRTN